MWSMTWDLTTRSVILDIVHSAGDLKTSACFDGRICKLATLDRSVAAFSTALSYYRFSLTNHVSSAPILNLTMVGLADSPWFVSMPGAWTIRLVHVPIAYRYIRGSVIRRCQNCTQLLRCFGILMERRLFVGFGCFSNSLLGLTKGTPK